MLRTKLSPSQPARPANHSASCGPGARREAAGCAVQAAASRRPQRGPPETWARGLLCPLAQGGLGPTCLERGTDRASRALKKNAHDFCHQKCLSEGTQPTESILSTEDVRRA